MEIFIVTSLVQSICFCINSKSNRLFKCCFETFLLYSITPPHIQSTTQQFESILTNTWNGSTTTNNPQQSPVHPQLDNAPINDNDDALFVPILLGIFIPFCFLSLLCGYYIKRSKRTISVFTWKTINYRRLELPPVTAIIILLLFAGVFKMLFLILKNMKFHFWRYF